MSERAVNKKTGGLKPYISGFGAWALGIGTSIGWGSVVITSNTYLSQAGPLGSTLGMAAGALIMLIISRNYSFLMERYPSAGGAYTYIGRIFGYDFSFVTAWFLGLTYASVFWANATSLPLFMRIFFGDIFRFGRMYTIFGYDVYFGEVLLTAAAILLAGYVCRRSKKGMINTVSALAVVFASAITLCFIAALFRRDGAEFSMSPAYIPDKSPLYQVVRIACISP